MATTKKFVRRSISQEEFDALPELPESDPRVMWFEENDPLQWMGTDLQIWEIGYLDRIRYRRKIIPGRGGVIERSLRRSAGLRLIP